MRQRKLLELFQEYELENRSKARLIKQLMF